MYERNRCVDEMTESLQRSLREAVWANASDETRALARARAARAAWLRRALLALAAAMLLLPLVGWRGGRAAIADAPAPSTPSRATVAYDVPVGTKMVLVLNDRLSSGQSRVGDAFTATVGKAVLTPRGTVAIPQGALVHGSVTGLDRSVQPNDLAAVRIEFDRLAIESRSYPFAAAVMQASVDVSEGDHPRDAAQNAEGGAPAGAMIGMVLTGDLEGLFGGAATGGGSVISLGCREAGAALPAGTELIVRTTVPIRLR